MARDWYTYTLPYRGWYWCYVSRIAEPYSWNNTTHLVRLPIVTEIVTLCGWKQNALALYQLYGELPKPAPEGQQCLHCRSFWVRRVCDGLTKYDDIPNEYRPEEGGD